MRKLLTFLGNTGYSPAKYKVNDSYILNSDEKEVESKYIQEALYELFKLDDTDKLKIIVFATTEAKINNWYDEDNSDNKGKLKNILEDKGLKENIDFSVVDIKSGMNSQELWENFDVITNQFDDNDDIYIDVTNSFRSIPIIFMAILDYVKVIKSNINIRGIYYGEFKKNNNDKGGNTNIVNLNAFITFQEWARATEQFFKTGNSQMLSDKMELAGEFLSLDTEKMKIVEVAESLRKYSEDLLLCKSKSLIEDSSKLISDLNEMREINNDEFLPFKKILNSILVDLEGYKGEATNDALYAVRKCADYKLFQQAFTILQEVFITYLTQKLNEEKRDNYVNNSQRDKIQKIKSIYVRNIDKGKLSPDLELFVKNIGNKNIEEYFKLYKVAAEYRNPIDHAEYTRKKEVSLEKLDEKLLDIMERFDSIRKRIESNDNSTVLKDDNKNCMVMLSHNLLDEQICELRKDFKVNNIIYLENELKVAWANINPREEIDKNLIARFEKEIKNKTQIGDFVIIQGEWGITFKMVNICLSLGRIPIYATTERTVSEKNIDGKVEIKKEFRHVMFRRYE